MDALAAEQLNIPVISNVDLTNITTVRMLVSHLAGRTKKPHNPYSKVDTVQEYLAKYEADKGLPPNVYFAELPPKRPLSADAA